MHLKYAFRKISFGQFCGPAPKNTWVLLISCYLLLFIVISWNRKFCWFAVNNHVFAWSITKSYQFWNQWVVLAFYISSTKSLPISSISCKYSAHLRTRKKVIYILCISREKKLMLLLGSKINMNTSKSDSNDYLFS